MKKTVKAEIRKAIKEGTPEIWVSWSEAKAGEECETEELLKAAGYERQDIKIRWKRPDLLKMTNEEMVTICENMAKKHNNDWPFAIEQNGNKIEIHWSYLYACCDGKLHHWTVDILRENGKGYFMVFDERGDLVEDLEDTTGLRETLESIAYYLSTRY